MSAIDSKVLVLTGGAGGIGSYESLYFAERGANLVIADLNVQDGQELADQIRSKGHQASFVELDVTDPASIDQAFGLVERDFGGADILVANTGIAGPAKPLIEITPEEWLQTVAINLSGVALTCRAVIPQMTAKGWGRIIVTGSTTGKRPVAGRTPYAATKLGLVGLARTLAHELGRSGITVNVVSPFDVESPRIEGMFARMAGEQGTDPASVRKAETDMTALGRLVFMEDVAKAVIFFSSPEADSITGHDLNVSCGAVMY